MFAVSEPATARHVTPKPTIQLVNTQTTWPAIQKGPFWGNFTRRGRMLMTFLPVR